MQTTRLYICMHMTYHLILNLDINKSLDQLRVLNILYVFFVSMRTDNLHKATPKKELRGFVIFFIPLITDLFMRSFSTFSI